MTTTTSTLACKLWMSFPFLCSGLYLFFMVSSMAVASPVPTSTRVFRSVGLNSKQCAIASDIQSNIQTNIQISMQNMRNMRNIQPNIPATIATLMLSVMIALPDGASAKPGDIAPTDKDNQLVQMAFRDFDLKRFTASEKEFTLSITKWLEIDRPRDEIVALLKARSSVRLDNKDFKGSLADCDEAIRLMAPDGEKPDGTAAYPEYPDSFVSRGLANEGLAEWGAALVDYNKAVALWGGGRGDDVNPYTLTFRGNTLGRLNRYEEAIEDYEAASNTFNSMRDVARYSDARANMALALYQVGRTDESVKAMNDVIRKNPGYADMHVAIAADAWSRGDYILALKEWRFACDRIEVGCKAYNDLDYLGTIRRWPPSLVKELGMFLNREIPDKLKGSPGAVLAPPRSTV